MSIYTAYSDTLLTICKNEDTQISKLYYTTKIQNYWVRYMCVSICMYVYMHACMYLYVYAKNI